MPGCHHSLLPSRRAALARGACGFGSLALAGLAGGAAAAGTVGPHLAPRATRIIFLFMAGGVSHVDSFDHKPRLYADDGKQLPFGDLRSIAKTGASPPQRVMKPLWSFARRGRSGHFVSDLFPEMGRIVDDLCLVKSMHTEGIAHGPATLFLHPGSTTAVRPSMGSWVHYGLGTENGDLPGFVSLSPALANGGPRNYGSAFLPAIHQGAAVGRAGQPPADATIKNLVPARTGAAGRRAHDLAVALNREQLRAHPADDELEAVIAAQELAARMQVAAPAVFDIAGETPETLALYGIGTKATDAFGRQCLLARRLVESGVRFVQVNYTDNSNTPAWDQHANMPKHLDHARAVDRPVAALVADLKRRGLLDDTIVWWGGEFGRTPYAQDNGTGRDHNPAGFTVWLAGGGFRAGHAHGATDEFGHHAVEDRVHMHDLHATLLAALGLDHRRLTYRHQGRDFRLTDVAGRVVEKLFA
ncbi:MAG: DUF1501 domain-containing protein [Pirellulales bacterium]